MYNVLAILLHRPFVADGHLYSNFRSISVNSFITCASAADQIVTLLRTYDSVFSVSRAPYLISYACYVAATIHVRIAAKRGADSEAHNRLAACLAIFRYNQETNGAVKRAHAIVQSLMKRLGVPEPSDEVISAWKGQAGPVPLRWAIGPAPNVAAFGDVTVPDATAARATRPTRSTAATEAEGPGFHGDISPSMGWSDIDGIIQSFVRGPEAQPQGMDFGSHAFAPDGFAHSSMPPMSRYANPAMEPVGPTDYRQVVDDGGMGWAMGMADGSASIDDLLFGLNGAALDSYTF